MLELAPDDAAAAALGLFRVGGLMLIAPFFGARVIPAMVRAAMAVLLTVLLLPAIGPSSGALVASPTALAGELIVGLGIGLGAATLLAGAELAGEILAVQTGLSGATALDPLTGQGTGVLGHLLQLFVLLLLLVTGGHLVMIEALAASYQVVPAGAAFSLTAGGLELLAMGGLLFTYGLQFAAPIIVAVSVGYIALGALARASPQLNMLAVAFPLQIGLGLLVLAGVLPLAATTFARWPEHVTTLAERFLAALYPG